MALVFRRFAYFSFLLLIFTRVSLAGDHPPLGHSSSDLLSSSSSSSSVSLPKSVRSFQVLTPKELTRHSRVETMVNAVDDMMGSGGNYSVESTNALMWIDKYYATLYKTYQDDLRLATEKNLNVDAVHEYYRKTFFEPIYRYYTSEDPFQYINADVRTLATIIRSFKLKSIESTGQTKVVKRSRFFNWFKFRCGSQPESDSSIQFFTQHSEQSPELRPGQSPEQSPEQTPRPDQKAEKNKKVEMELACLMNESQAYETSAILSGPIALYLLFTTEAVVSDVAAAMVRINYLVVQIIDPLIRELKEMKLDDNGSEVTSSSSSFLSFSSRSSSRSKRKEKETLPPDPRKTQILAKWGPTLTQAVDDLVKYHGNVYAEAVTMTGSSVSQDLLGEDAPAKMNVSSQQIRSLAKFHSDLHDETKVNAMSYTSLQEFRTLVLGMYKELSELDSSGGFEKFVDLMVQKKIVNLQK